jgi:hypothetical protein
MFIAFMISSCLYLLRSSLVFKKKNEDYILSINNLILYTLFISSICIIILLSVFSYINTQNKFNDEKQQWKIENSNIDNSQQIYDNKPNNIPKLELDDNKNIVTPPEPEPEPEPEPAIDKNIPPSFYFI